MKIVFLDIDGVLNSEDWAYTKIKVGDKYRLRNYGGFFTENTDIDEEDVLWDPACVTRLVEIIANTGASIVMSSTWRIKFSVEKFKQMFAFYGWENPPIIDKTIELGGRRGVFYHEDARGLEVHEWLSRHPEVTNYVILDDMQQFLPDQQVHFVQTNPITGLDDTDVNNAISILTKLPYDGES